MSVGAYIDLNAVRAGIVERPEDYRWCGYAEAHAGRMKAQKAFASLLRSQKEPNWNETEERYGWLIRAPHSPSAACLRERNAIFTRALVLGSRRFILETYARFPRVFTAKRRPSHPYVTDVKTDQDAICASHRPREAAMG